MTATRRNLLGAGFGAMAMTVGAGSRAQGTQTKPEITVIGVDGSDRTSAAIGEYRRGGADVWQFSDNIIDLEYLQGLQDFADRNSSRIALAKSYADILAAKRAGKVAMVVGCQECTVFEPEWKDNYQKKPTDWSVNPPVTTVAAYHDKGLRIANLAYNLANFFGGGCLDATTPLSRAGQFLVGQLQEIGILVDCSHSSERTSLDIVKIATRPVVCSHSNPAALVDNPRNVSDRLIEGIAKTGGLIGVNALNFCLVWNRKYASRADHGPFPPLAGLSKYVDMIDYLRRLVGIDYIGIGSDFGASKFVAPPPSKSFLYPPEMTYNQPNGLQYVSDFNRASQLPNLRTELRSRGYSSVDIAKICGGNWMRVFRQAWNA